MSEKLSDKYKEYFTDSYMMGPNSIRLMDELMSKCSLESCNRILDLGCGTGLTSLFLAKETAAQIFAVDLWCSPKDNYERFGKWGISERVIPLHVDANDLPFSENYFNAIVSVDAYHYFAREADFFQSKVFPFLKPGGVVLIAIPGIRKEFDGEIPKGMLDWAGEEYDYFHSCAWWKETIGIKEAQVWEMECFNLAWEEWFVSGHEFGVQDKKFFDTVIQKYMNFVGIAVRKPG